MNSAPFIPVKEVIFPGVITTIFVGRETSIKALEAAIMNNNKMVLFLQRDREEENPDIDSGLHRVGVLVSIVQSTKLPDGIVRVLLESEKRVKLLNFHNDGNIFKAEYSIILSDENSDVEEEALKRKVLDSFEEYLRVSSKISPELIVSIKNIKSINKLLDLISSNINISIEEKQLFLEIISVHDRAYEILKILNEEIEVIKLKKQIDTKVKDQMTSLQKNYFLKEKIKAIEELGDDSSYADDIEDIRENLDSINLSEDIKKKLHNEVNKLNKMPPYSSEYSVVKNYIDTILELPWDKSTKDRIDITKAKKILDKDHYGLEEVKERILEFLAVKKLNKDLKGSILCLVGPPGVGKTSLSKSIAKSLGRKFARISLGGVKDESEIRGHRKTYVGAMPGRIIKELKYIDSNNPLILLDEIDKISQDYRGDPASALLEVLDIEQNKDFVDNYLEIPFDLSKIFFIATANDVSMIPSALYDRLEIIDISSYTIMEKLQISKRYLLDKSKDENGLKRAKITVTDKAIKKIIDEYTAEAGVRQLKRKSDKIFRKLAKKSLDKKLGKIIITEKKVEKYLGIPKYLKDKNKKKEGKIGIVNGLAWTSIGGKTLEVQSTLLPGKGDFITTGQLGEVMQESTKVALSFVRSISEELGIGITKFTKEHLHIHFPAGGTPKDGPSAGIAISTAIISALKRQEVRQDIAMTGEVTVTGEVLAVGGIKEKIIGAHRVGIREVIIPLDNKADCDELPKEIKKVMKIHYAEYYKKDVLDKVFFNS